MPIGPFGLGDPGADDYDVNKLNQAIANYYARGRIPLGQEYGLPEGDYSHVGFTNRDSLIRGTHGAGTYGRDAELGIDYFAPTSGKASQFSFPTLGKDSFMDNLGLYAVLAIAGGGLLAGATGAGGAGAAGQTAGTLASGLPESYWSMLADAGGGAANAAGTIGGMTGDLAGLTQMGQAAGLQGAALDAFVQSGGTLGSTAGGGTLGSLINGLQNIPPGTGTVAQQVLNGGGGGGDVGNSVGGNLATPTNSLPTGNGVFNAAGTTGFNLANLLNNPGSLASLISGGLQGLGAYTGANIQADAANNATAAQLAMFNTLNQQSAPWRQAGQAALGTISDMMPQFTHSFDANDLKTHLAPNYDFMLNQGLNAVQNRLNVGSGALSGNTIKGINDYTQDYAGNAYQQAFNNYNAQQSNIFNRLSNIAGLGQTANQTSATAGTQLGIGAGNSMQNAGTAAGGGVVGATNAITGGMNNALGWYMLPQFLNYGANYG